MKGPSIWLKGGFLASGLPLQAFAKKHFYGRFIRDFHGVPILNGPSPFFFWMSFAWYKNCMIYRVISIATFDEQRDQRVTIFIVWVPRSHSPVPQHCLGGLRHVTSIVWTDFFIESKEYPPFDLKFMYGNVGVRNHLPTHACIRIRVHTISHGYIEYFRSQMHIQVDQEDCLKGLSPYFMKDPNAGKPSGRWKEDLSHLVEWGYSSMDGLYRKILFKWMMTGGSPIVGNLHF